MKKVLLVILGVMIMTPVLACPVCEEVKECGYRGCRKIKEAEKNVKEAVKEYAEKIKEDVKNTVVSVL